MRGNPPTEKNKGAGLVPVVASLFFIFVLSGLSLMGVYIASGALDPQEKTPYLYQEYILRAKAFERMGRQREAFGYYKMAVKAAPNGTMRAEAGLAISDYLLDRAEAQPRPFALMAKQYLDAVLDLTEDPAVLIKAYKGIRKAGFLLDDLQMVSDASEHILALSTVDAAKAQILLEWMDMCLAYGTLNQMQDLLLLAKPYEDDAYWKTQFELRRLKTDSQILMRPEWGEAFFSSAADIEKALLREGLYEATMTSYQELADGSNAALTDECLYQMASLAVNEGDIEQGRELINDFLLREPDDHLDESLLLLAKIARIQGRSENADQMITRFLQRYGMKAGATDELLALLDQMEKEGQIDKALDLVKEFLKYPLEPAMYPYFVARAAHLAAMGGHYLEGEKYMEELLTMNIDQSLVSLALLEQADACMASGAYMLAEKWLLQHLQLFPDDPLQGECLFKLYDVKRKGGGQVTDIMLAGMAAIDEAPSDIRSMQTLIKLAHMLEDLGLYNLAQVQYSKVGLLRMTTTGNNRTESDVMGQAVLGSARCLLKLGEVVKADHILREICNNYGPGAVRSEAAYLWATIARDNGQLREASRRLALAELGQVNPELQARIIFEKNVLDIASGKGTPQGLMALASRLTDLESNTDLDFARKAYMFCFRELADDRDIDGMQELLDIAVGQPFAEHLPLRVFCLQLATVILEENGMSAFVKCLEEYQNLFASAPEDLKTGIQQMIDNVEYIGKTNSNLGKIL